MSASQWVINVDDHDFEHAVVQKSHDTPVVVDFWAPWCGPCRALSPLLEGEVERRGGEVVLAKVNVDEAPGLAAGYQVQSIPLVVAFSKGKPVDEFMGLVSEAQLAEFFDRICPNEADKLVRQAAALEKDDPDQAERLYRTALERQPHHEAARVGIARAMLTRGRDDEAAELLNEVGVVGDTGAEAERLRGVIRSRAIAKQFGDEAAARKGVEENPKDFEARYRLGAILAAAGRHEEALKTLIAAAEMGTPGGPQKVREVMVEIFHTLGVGNPLANEYRPRLAELLY